MFRHTPQSHFDDLAILSDERHEIRNRSKCCNIQIIRVEPLLLHLPKRLYEFEGDTDPREFLVRIGAVHTMRIDHCVCRRQCTSREMVIGDDNVHPRIQFRNCLYGRNSAVNGNEQVAPLCGELLKCPAVETIPLREAVRNIVGDPASECANILHKQCGRGHPVHVVIPIDDNLLPGVNRVQNAPHSFLHISHEKRIMKRLLLWMQESPRSLCRMYPSIPENLSNERCSSNFSCECISLRRFFPYNPFFQHGSPYNSKRACPWTGSLLYPSTAAGFAAGRRSVRLRSSIQSWLAMKMEE